MGIGALFAMILLLGIQSVSYVRQLSHATGTILADNYNSLQYAGDMLRSLNDIGHDSVSRHVLRQSLALQQQNITEISEKEMTTALERHIASLSDPVTEAEIQTVREDLFRIMELNMAAIRSKSSGVEQRADYVMWWLIVVAALCVLSAGAILIWFPQTVLRPIDTLKRGIKEIANHNYRQRLDSCTAARVFFISPGDSRIELTLNDSLRREFEVEGAAAVRQVTVTAPHIRSLAFKVNSGTEGFIGYGAVFEADGVVVDNYSVRSNNGQAMFWTNPSVNAQINAHAGYDLVILQYGLNIMQTGVHNYTNYARQIEKMVVYVQQCFPTAAVLVLGVSDRSVKTDAGFEPMDAIPYMLDYQRGAAENTGAAFWPTCDAMRSLGGMEQFVANGWAGKDYTHINYAGGRRVAWSLVDAINAGAYEAHAAAEAARIRRQAEQAVLDSTRLLKIDRELLPVRAIENLNAPRK